MDPRPQALVDLHRRVHRSVSGMENPVWRHKGVIAGRVEVGLNYLGCRVEAWGIFKNELRLSQFRCQVWDDWILLGDASFHQMEEGK